MSTFRSPILFVVLSLLMAAPQARAETPSKSTPVVFATAAVGSGVSLKSGTRFPPAMVYGVGVLVPFSGGWAYYNEVALATTFIESNPGFQLVTGPSKKLGDKLSVGVSGVYKLQPLYDGASPPMHIMGVSVAPIFKTSFGALSVPMGAGYNASTSDPSFVLNLKASVRL